MIVGNSLKSFWSRGDQKLEQEWSRIRSLAFLLEPEWIRSRHLPFFRKAGTGARTGVQFHE